VIEQQHLNQQAYEQALAELRAVPKEERAQHLKASGILTESGELAPPYAYRPRKQTVTPIENMRSNL